MPQDWNYGTDRPGDASYCRRIRERRDFERNRLVSSTIIQGHMTIVEGLPNWHFNINEVSAGVYRIEAVHKLGSKIEVSGTEDRLAALMADVRAAAVKMELEIHEKISQKKP
jgi:hypothetical protein